jgi:hypothetical protein
MNRQAPPAPPGWNRTIQDLTDEAKKTGSAVGSPEVDWARDYERSLIPAGTRFPKKGDVYEAIEDINVHYMTAWAAPYSGGGEGILHAGDRVLVSYDPTYPQPVAVYAQAVDYARVEERMVPESDRSNKKYNGFYFFLRTADLSRIFRLVHEESTPAEYQGNS